MTSSRVCLDASFFVKLAVQEDGSEKAIELWHRWTLDGTNPVAPTLIWYETTSTLRKRVHRGDITAEEASLALEDLMTLSIVSVSSPDLHKAALGLAARLNQPAAYDAHYLALTLELGCPFWTADRRLYNAVKGDLSEIYLVS